MIAAPAIDLRRGRCVQLVGGRPEEERVSLPDPLAVARRWREAGFGTLHVVDLDAALSDGDNRALVVKLTAEARRCAAPEAGAEARRRAATDTGSDARPGRAGAPGDPQGSLAVPHGGGARRGGPGAPHGGPGELPGAPGEPHGAPGDPHGAPRDPHGGPGGPGAPTRTVVQAGGGIRDDAAAAELLHAGVERVIVGTRAVDDPAWLGALAAAHPGRVMVAADVRDGRVLRRGWTESSPLGVFDFLERLRDVPLAGVLCTDVAREGRMEGIDRRGSARLVDASAHPLWISGGIHTMDDLRALAGAGAAGAVLGMALYTGALDGATAAREFGA